MNDKKKYLGIKMVVLLLFLLSNLVVFSTTSYANMSSDYLDYGLSTLKDNYTGSYQSDARQALELLLNDSISKNIILDRINSQLNTWGISNITDNNIFCNLTYGSDGVLKFFIFNNTVPNGYDYLDFFLISNERIKGRHLNSSDHWFQYNITFRKNNNTITLTKFEYWNVSSASETSAVTWGNKSFSDDTNTVLTCTNIFCAGLPGGYSYYPLTSSSNIIPVILKDMNGNYNPVTPEPEPSGDIPVDTVNTGTITNNSGDKTGQIDLSGITSGLNNLNTNVQNVQNQISGDTQKIIENQNSIAQQQHNDLINYDVDDGEEEVSSLIDNINSTLSGDLSNSEIFGALEQSEQGFLDLISGQAEDFEIHWNDVLYNGVKLIPAGQVNFSALCRENESLGNIKEKLNIILSALCGLGLIKYLYNLLLATLGIDNPYLYDNNSDADYIKTVDKNTGTTTFSGVDKDGTRWRYTYNSKANKGGKKK